VHDEVADEGVGLGLDLGLEMADGPRGDVVREDLAQVGVQIAVGGDQAFVKGRRARRRGTGRRRTPAPGIGCSIAPSASALLLDAQRVDRAAPGGGAGGGVGGRLDRVLKDDVSPSSSKASTSGAADTHWPWLSQRS